ncbi:MAG: penicillin-binding protein 2, partial [Gaiellales bacterium]
MSVKRANRRIRLLVALFALVFGLAFARAGWLQAVKAQGLDRLATNQHRETVDVPAHRGTIYDWRGVELAIGGPATTVYANPREIREPRLVALAVEEELGVSAEELLPKLADRSRGFVYVARQADPKDAEALERRGIAGLGFYPEERRRYPQRSVGAEVVGYAGVDNRGLAGLELRFDQILRGTGGTKTIVKDPLGHTLEVVESDSVEDGKDVHLTLDHTIQGQVERILAQTVQDWSAQSASAVVLDPRTGGVLALAVEPGFDANAFPGVPPDRQRNRAVTDTYEPGSTFKIVTISAALESGLVSPGTRFTLPYELQVADRVIHDAEERGTVTMSVAQILSQSSNIGVITVALMLQSEALHEWIKRFGFGRETGID